MDRWIASCLAGCFAGCFGGALLAASPSTAQAPLTKAAGFQLACTFQSTSGEMEVEQACAMASSGAIPVLAPRVLARLAYPKGLATFAIHDNGWYHRRRDGTTRRMVTFDNGPDYFVEGLARAIVDGRIAYIDRRLRIRIRTGYDWGDQFDQGRADVCLDCRAVPTGDGEHSVMTGGRWGMIDKSGRELLPVTLTRSELVARKGKAR